MSGYATLTMMESELERVDAVQADDDSQIRHLERNITRPFGESLSQPPAFLRVWHPTATLGQISQDGIHKVPHEAGLLYFSGDSATGSSCVATRDIRSYLEQEHAESLEGRTAIWVVGNPWDLVDESPALNTAGSALRPGRMRTVADPAALKAVPQAWGLYRIALPDGSIYVGITSNLRRRFSEHRASGLLDFASGGFVHYSKARPAATWKQMRDTEKDHIRRMEPRGLSLANLCSGGNGHPPAWGMNF